jgi:hypothetical protein
MAGYIARRKFCWAARRLRGQPAMSVVGYIGPASPDDTPYAVVSRCF